jgi:transposase
VILLPGAVRVFVAREPIDMRKSFEGISNLVEFALGHDPLSGHVFVFLNRKKTLVKLLVWTRGGFTIVYKRLEAGRFAFPERVAMGASSVEIDIRELSMLLEGVDLDRGRMHRRWEPPSGRRRAA